MEREPAGPGAEPGEEAGELAYESYLDGALLGAAEAPAVFLERHPEAGPETRARIEALHRLARGAPRSPASVPGIASAAPGLPWERLGDFPLLPPPRPRRLGVGFQGG